MTEPQLIFFDKGEFQKGRIIPYTESHYVGLDIRGNSVLYDERINPLSLHLVSAGLLPPRVLSETVSDGDDSIIKKKSQNYKSAVDLNRADNIGAVVLGIVNEPQHVALNAGVPYFSVAAVTSNPDAKPRNLDAAPLSFIEYALSNLLREEISKKEKIVKHTILHPTVQLYVPR